jgi:hypothetical protein
LQSGFLHLPVEAGTKADTKLFSAGPSSAMDAARHRAASEAEQDRLPEDLGPFQRAARRGDPDQEDRMTTRASRTA